MPQKLFILKSCIQSKIAKTCFLSVIVAYLTIIIMSYQGRESNSCIACFQEKGIFAVVMQKDPAG
jgi:hypothetical protein